MTTLRRYAFVLFWTAVAFAAALGFLRLQADDTSVSAKDGRVVRLGWGNSGSLPPLTPPRGPTGRAYNSSDLHFYLMHAAAQRAGWRIEWVEGPWSELVEGVRTGRIDGLAQVLRTPARETFAWFTDPYFEPVYNAFVRKGHEAPLAELLAKTKSGELRVARVRGFAYPQALEEATASGEGGGSKSRVVVFASERLALQGVAHGEADWVLMDSMQGASLLQRDVYLQRALHMQATSTLTTRTHVMFSRLNLSEPEVAAFNTALQALKRDDEFSRIVRGFQYPALLSYVTQLLLLSEFFVIGVLAMTLTGIVIAHREGYSLVGALVLAAAPGAGGGLIRDLALGRNPPAVARDPSIMGVVVLAVAAGWVFYRLILPRLSFETQQRVNTFDIPQSPLLVFFESIALGIFTVLGVLVAMEMRAEPLWLWGPLAAGITAGGGGILREVLRANMNIATIRGRLHMEPPIVWALLLSLFLLWYAEHPPHYPWVVQLAIAATVLGVMLTRWVALRRGWTSPMY